MSRDSKPPRESPDEDAGLSQGNDDRCGLSGVSITFDCQVRRAESLHPQRRRERSEIGGYEGTIDLGERQFGRSTATGDPTGPVRYYNNQAAGQMMDDGPVLGGRSERGRGTGYLEGHVSTTPGVGGFQSRRLAKGREVAELDGYPQTGGYAASASWTTAVLNSSK